MAGPEAPGLLGVPELPPQAAGRITAAVKTAAIASPRHTRDALIMCASLSPSSSLLSAADPLSSQDTGSVLASC